jgi:phosphopantothenoylcysteine synthetase/decarboxylase
MKCVITAGPTYESLDNVRRLTNFSTGQLGCELAAFVSRLGHETILLIGEQATYAGERNASRVETFTTTLNLSEKLAALSAQNVNAVFHAAAVSDFTFRKIWSRASDGKLTEVKAGKLSTRQGTLLAELLPTPKLIRELRTWFPNAVLVGWKFEVDGDRKSLVRQAQAQMAECHTDACVANGPAYGDGFGLVGSGGEVEHCEDRKALFGRLAGLIKPRIQTPNPNKNLHVGG